MINTHSGHSLLTTYLWQLSLRTTDARHSIDHCRHLDLPATFMKGLTTLTTLTHRPSYTHSLYLRVTTQKALHLFALCNQLLHYATTLYAYTHSATKHSTFAHAASILCIIALLQPYILLKRTPQTALIQSTMRYHTIEIQSMITTCVHLMHPRIAATTRYAIINYALGSCRYRKLLPLTSSCQLWHSIK